MISLYFGSPGAGKSTTAAWLAYKKFGKRPVYANFDCAFTYRFDVSQLGLVQFPRGSLILVDEAGICFNNRKFKTMPMHVIEFLKLHRHYGVDIAFFSQSWEDVDITIRRLATHLYYIRKLPFFTMIRHVNSFVFIDKEKHQIQEGYRFESFLGFLFLSVPIRFIYRPFYYFMFNSYEAPSLQSFPKVYWNDTKCPSSVFLRYVVKTPERVEKFFKRLWIRLKGGFPDV